MPVVKFFAFLDLEQKSLLLNAHLAFVQTLTKRGVGEFFINRYMDKFLLNRMNSRHGIVKKKQEIIFEISIGS
jgi:anti-sigma regulatory factor (Ser/Thr protein kinase)